MNYDPRDPRNPPDTKPTLFTTLIFVAAISGLGVYGGYRAAAYFFGA